MQNVLRLHLIQNNFWPFLYTGGLIILLVEVEQTFVVCLVIRL